MIRLPAGMRGLDSNGWAAAAVSSLPAMEGKLSVSSKDDQDDYALHTKVFQKNTFKNIARIANAVQCHN